MVKTRLSKTENALERAYLACHSKNKFRKVENNSYADYVVRSQKDIASAEND